MLPLDVEDIWFPDPSLYHPENGIVAFGGDLSVERLLLAYENGIFPWYNPGEEILWWSPDPRFVIFPDELRVSKSMQKVLKSGQFTFTENQNFKEVMTACMHAQRKNQDGTWISPQLVESYVKLHQLGYAKSVEVWDGGALVGGFYGMQIGQVFCGESMFATVSNASKAGFIYFVQKYRNELKLIDCQTHTSHLESLGGRMIPKLEFLEYLKT